MTQQFYSLLISAVKCVNPDQDLLTGSGIIVSDSDPVSRVAGAALFWLEPEPFFLSGSGF